LDSSITVFDMVRCLLKAFSEMMQEILELVRKQKRRKKITQKIFI
jgi:hypothetical protein